MTSTETAPQLKPGNGLEMPALGLGVYQSAPEDTLGAVEAALADGYRLIDTAAAYGNEREAVDRHDLAEAPIRRQLARTTAIADESGRESAGVSDSS